MTLSPADPHTAVIRSPDHLRQFWSAAMGPGGFAQRTLWIAFFDADDRPLPTLVPFDDVPREPDASVDQLAAIIASAISNSPTASLALLLARPGPVACSGSDRRWGHALVDAFGVIPVKLWPVHLATTDGVIALTPPGSDDSVARS